MTDDRTKGSSYLVYEIERRAYPLGETPFTIGRDASSGIVIREPAVSRSHAEVRPDADEFVLHSTGATGTRLNGEPVTAPTKLTDGDSIEVGSVEMTFRQGRLPLGVSVVDVAAMQPQDPDVTSRRSTITNPILGDSKAAPAKKMSITGTLILFGILVAAAAFYFLAR